MSNSRILTIRKSDSVLTEQIMLPLLFIGPQFGYSAQSILRHIHGAPDVHIGEEPNTFPHTIQEYLWIQQGEPGKEPWVALGILDNGAYFLFTAYMSVPTNTFLNNGHMNLWTSTRFSDLVQFGMDSSIYNLYIEKTNTQNTISAELASSPSDYPSEDSQPPSSESTQHSSQPTDFSE